MNRNLLTLSLIGLTLAFSQASFAIDAAAKPLQQQWAVIKYQTAKKEREKAFKKLAAEAKQVEQQNPKDPEVLVWEAIILSTYAGEKGGFGALGLVKDAKGLLEKAEKIDPKVLNGSVYTSLGSLYYQVPGWPLGFGDDDEAEKLLEKALQIAPDSIDANFFYGDYLIEEGRYQEAVKALEKALNAPDRPGREVADAGRREEIKQKLGEARKHL
jgi:tetratricopeptide (TPR) repeat protein